MGEFVLVPVILMADDDEDDCLLARSALEEAGIAKELRIVGDGGELMEYLSRRGRFFHYQASHVRGMGRDGKIALSVSACGRALILLRDSAVLSRSVVYA